jgi:hypothetical protein
MSEPAVRGHWGRLVAALVLIAAVAGYIVVRSSRSTDPPSRPDALNYQPRKGVDTGGYLAVIKEMEPWGATASLEEVAAKWKGGAPRLLARIDSHLAEPGLAGPDRIQTLIFKATTLNYDGHPDQAYAVLADTRSLAEADPADAEAWLYSVIYFQGVTALRRGETENCVMCRGEGSCTLPISAAAVHTNPAGSRLAIKHFTEYLDRFPDDLAVRWLLNVAHMTLAEHPDGVDPRYLIRIDRFTHSEFDIGRFRDIGAKLGVNQLNESGGTILEDFHGDGRLDILFTNWNAARPARLYRNVGDGTFADVTEKAGLLGQLGGLGCVQADFDNDGHMDIFLPRGAWLDFPVRPSLLRNNGNGTFSDVTEKAGLATALNSDTAQWTDFDNDGLIDLFIACEQQPNRLYRNNGNGTFTDVAAAAGLADARAMWKGAAWIDADNDGYPDLFLNAYSGAARFFHNNRNGTFTDATAAMGIDGPRKGLSCWAWDYDNDGWLDIFATSFDRTTEDVVKGLLGEPHARESNRLYRNLGGKGFQDVTKETGLDLCFSSMGTNFGDFDNDGYLDFYLGTGDHDLATLVPNRMFKNVGGKRFADITGTSGTGNLQKGHGVACGDWDRDGNVDIAIQMGGALPGDSYHNIVYQNPGQGNNWLNVKLVGKKTNRAAIGARIKVTTAGAAPLTIHRHISSGSSFGANPMEQMIGLGKANRVATVEVYWPTSGQRQVFRDMPANSAIEITESVPDYRKRPYTRIPVPN